MKKLILLIAIITCSCSDDSINPKSSDLVNVRLELYCDSCHVVRNFGIHNDDIVRDSLIVNFQVPKYQRITLQSSGNDSLAYYSVYYDNQLYRNEHVIYDNQSNLWDMDLFSYVGALED